MPTLTIAKRELTSLFYSPIAYVVLGVFALVSTLLFLMSFIPGQAATLRDEFGWLVWLMAFIVPAISMRLVSEELRSGTIEPLMTSPISDTQVIIGKWIGGLGFFLVMLSPLVVHVIVLEINADPDYGPIASGAVGLLFVGGLYMAIGVFVSSMTQNQIIAFLITVLITGFLTIGMHLLKRAEFLSDWMREAVFFLNVDEQYGSFSKGLIDLSNFTFFITGIALFLFLAVVTLQSKRWR
jgi:ABC-2 type transport system permease protein